MWYNFKIEWRRYWKEMFHFKFNLFFANIGLLVLFLGLLDYLDVTDKETVLILLFVWYSATHGFININYIIEEEIMDGTLVHILGTRVSFLRIIFLRSFIQMIYDFIKASIVFSIILCIGDFDYSWLSGMSMILTGTLIIVCIFISYFLGLIIGAMTLKYKKLSAIPNLLYYFVLFFGGITYNISSLPILEFISYLFPFLPLRVIIHGMQNGQIDIQFIGILFIQGLIYLGIGVLLYHLIMKENYRSGSIFYV